jgi:hypothetical protein
MIFVDADIHHLKSGGNLLTYLSTNNSRRSPPGYSATGNSKSHPHPVEFTKSTSGAQTHTNPRCRDAIRDQIAAPDRSDPDRAEPGHCRMPRIHRVESVDPRHRRDLHREPRSRSSFSSSDPRPTMLMAQTCSGDSPARRRPALSSCKSRLTLKAGRGRSGWVGGPIRRLPRITHW